MLLFHKSHFPRTNCGSKNYLLQKSISLKTSVWPSLDHDFSQLSNSRALTDSTQKLTTLYFSQNLKWISKCYFSSHWLLIDFSRLHFYFLHHFLFPLVQKRTIVPSFHVLDSSSHTLWLLFSTTVIFPVLTSQFRSLSNPAILPLTV